ncbi:MAG: hypothetical protein LR015_11415 [Verrucomicrobia bacterium]|nr:hypothetical protein [Verrucomicrobiota bacterium]
MEFILPYTVSLLALGAISVGCTVWATRAGNPLPLVPARWTRWAFLGLGAAYLFNLSGWLDQPFQALLVVCILGWFLIEITYVWLAVRALSDGDFPLFPKYEPGDRSSQWPSSPRFIGLRQWLRSQGFNKLAHLQSHHGDQLLSQLYIFENQDKTIRINVLFLTNFRGVVTDCCEFISQTTEDVRLVTDNLFLPFGGFYPESWHVERKPWTRSINSLYQRHLARLDAAKSPTKPLTMDASDAIRLDTRLLEKLNLELGFLEYAEYEEGTRIRVSAAGRYRIWQEILTLSYFGWARSY